MKKIGLLLMFCFLLNGTMMSQIVPNGGFESWAGGSPVDWYANNIATMYTTVTQSATAHSGSSSAQGSVVSYHTTSTAGPLLQSGAAAGGFAVSQRFQTVSAYYQFNSLSGDKFYLSCIMYKGAAVIGTVATFASASVSSWTLLSADIKYTTSDIPDKCIIQILIIGPVTGSDYHVGSFYLLDDISLSGTATSVTDKEIKPAKYLLEQNYPNPFNPSTVIKYSVPFESNVNIKIYNSLGQIVREVNEGTRDAGNYEINFTSSGLASGIYFYSIKALSADGKNDFSSIKKMILMK